MSSFTIGDMNIPNGYVEEKIEGQLNYEDLDEDSELWLIRVPSDIQLSLLDKKKIYLGSNSDDVNVKDIKTEGGKILECMAENREIPNMCVVLPEKSSKKLQVVRNAFKGAILISEGLNLTDENSEVKTENHENLQSICINDIPNTPHTSKRKKKIRNSHESIWNYETEDADSASHPVTKRKNSKKRSEISKESSENTEIKSEPESMDSYEFPTCRSQS